MLSRIEKEIIRVLCYADIFDYPLNLEEICKWSIKYKSQYIRQVQDKKSKIKIAIKNSKLIQEKEGYYFLIKRESIINLRKKRKKYSREKSKIAQKIVSILKFIPYIKLIGITGALAVDNAKEDDDIDLFIVTSRNLLWTTRFLATILTEITGIRRHPGDKDVKNMICLNMFADEDHLKIPKREQDLFSAHEVLQMIPLWEKDNTYKKFLYVNKWVKKFLPNAYYLKHNPETYQESTINLWTNNADRQNLPIFHFLHKIEVILKRLQLWYMRNRRTTEVIKDDIIRFHPRDARVWVLKEYNRRLKNYSVK